MLLLLLLLMLDNGTRSGRRLNQSAIVVDRVRIAATVGRHPLLMMLLLLLVLVLLLMVMLQSQIDGLLISQHVGRRLVDHAVLLERVLVVLSGTDLVMVAVVVTVMVMVGRQPVFQVAIGTTCVTVGVSHHVRNQHLHWSRFD